MLTSNHAANSSVILYGWWTSSIIFIILNSSLFFSVAALPRGAFFKLKFLLQKQLKQKLFKNSHYITSIFCYGVVSRWNSYSNIIQIFTVSALTLKAECKNSWKWNNFDCSNLKQTWHLCHVCFKFRTLKFSYQKSFILKIWY